MKTISLDNNNNILLDNYGNIAFKENAQALAQDIANELRSKEFDNENDDEN